MTDLQFTKIASPSMTTELPEWAVPNIPTGPDNITFTNGGEVLKLDSQGFHYRGQFIEDAGEAHRLFVEFMRRVNGSHD